MADASGPVRPAQQQQNAEVHHNLDAPWAKSEPDMRDQGGAAVQDILARLGGRVPQSAQPARQEPLPTPQIGQAQQSHPQYGLEQAAPSAPAAPAAVPEGYISRDEFQNKLQELQKQYEDQMAQMQYQSFAQDYGREIQQQPAGYQAQGATGRELSGDERVQAEIDRLRQEQQAITAQQQQLQWRQWWDGKRQQYQAEAARHELLRDPSLASIAWNYVSGEIQRSNGQRPVGAIVTGFVNDLSRVLDKRMAEARTNKVVRDAALPGGIPSTASAPSGTGAPARTASFGDARSRLEASVHQIMQSRRQG